MSNSLLIEAVENIQEEKAIFLAKKMLKEGVSREDIIDDIQQGLDKIGVLYEKSEYFIADLMMAGILFKEILMLDGMQKKSSTDENLGMIMVATVAGDIHDIGKDIFAGFAQAAGFHVIDLGTDVKGKDIIENIEKYQPDVLGLSAILTHATKTVKSIITSIEEAGLRDKIKIIVGGSAFKDFIPTDIKADNIVADANEGVKKIKEWMKEKNKG